jgi:hypothetical protein
MNTLYIYNNETKEIVATASGETNQECEEKASIYDDCEYGWSYSKNGLVDLGQDMITDLSR